MATNNQLNSPEPFAITAGGTGVSSVSIVPAATAWAGWDSNKNFSANSFLAGYTTIATAAGTTTLTVASTQSQFFTGSTTQTVVLPVTSTLALGQSFYIVNNSSGVVTVQSSGGNTIQAMASGTTLYVYCILTSGTTAASWYAEYTSQTSGANFPVNTNITSMTGLTGPLKAPTFIDDVNGNHVLSFGSNASAVNYWAISNATAAGPTVVIAPAGTSTTINAALITKGGASFQIQDSTGAARLELFNAGSTHGITLTVGTLSADTTFTLPVAVPGVTGAALVSTTGGVMSFSSTPVSTVPQVTVFTSGSGTYSVPSNCLYLLVEGIGGGGGGAGSGTIPGAATGGGNTTFGSSLLTGNGGTLGSAAGGAASGGSATGGDVNITGGNGGGASGIANAVGGRGGSGYYGGEGVAGATGGGAGGAAIGPGGGGGGAGEIATNNAGGGGGAGGYFRKIITSPSASYSYAVGGAGSAGTAGTGGAAGGAGAAGIISVTAYFQ